MSDINLINTRAITPSVAHINPTNKECCHQISEISFYVVILTL